MKNNQDTDNKELEANHWPYNTPLFYAQKLRILTRSMIDCNSMTIKNIEKSTDFAAIEKFADECEEFICNALKELSFIINEVQCIIESGLDKNKIIEFHDGRQYFTIENYEKIYYSARQIRLLRQNLIVNSDSFGPIELASIDFWCLSSFCGGFGTMEQDFDLFSREMYHPKKENALKFQDYFIEKINKVTEGVKEI